MPIKNTFLLITLILSIGRAPAQQKMAEPINGKDTGFVFFPADSTIQPTSTSVIIYAEPAFSERADKLISILGKKGVAVAKAEHENTELDKMIQCLQTSAISHKVNTPKIGILAFGSPNKVHENFDFAAFIGIINPGSIPKIHVPYSIPLLIDENNSNINGIINFYIKRNKTGSNIELHMHQQQTSDSAQRAGIINWMGDLGLLKPISTEKTTAQKKQKDWADFMKIIDDRLHNDWPWLKRYESDNEQIPAPAEGEKRIVFLGNSITEGWINHDPAFFKSHNYINRGIGGQTTPQMLVRFREDVVNLHPHTVIILAGINDIAQNTGPSKLENVAGNIISMAEIAKANDIRVILCSVLPAKTFPWHPGIDPVPLIINLNAMLKNYAENNKLEYVDYYSAVVDEKQAFKKNLAIDGVHPNLAGYKIMEPLAEAAIKKALSAK
jgi:lysophospholipase L1-like esterase